MVPMRPTGFCSRMTRTLTLFFCTYDRNQWFRSRKYGWSRVKSRIVSRGRTKIEPKKLAPIVACAEPVLGVPRRTNPRTLLKTLAILSSWGAEASARLNTACVTSPPMLYPTKMMSPSVSARADTSVGRTFAARSGSAIALPFRCQYVGLAA